MLQMLLPRLDSTAKRCAGLLSGYVGRLPLVSPVARFSHMSAFESFHSDNLFTAGSFAEDRLAELQSRNIRSVLYIATDAVNDISFQPGGFPALQAKIPSIPVTFIPFDSQEAEFQPDESALAVPWQRVLAYKRFEQALQALPLPCLLACKSGRRAGAVISAYRAVAERLTGEQALHRAKAEGLSFLGSAGMRAWVSQVVDSLSRRNPLIFKQLYESESSTYTYLLADSVTKECVLIDPVLETVERDAKLVQELGLSLKYMLNTHVHADHISGTAKLKGKFPSAKSVLTERQARADIHVNEYEPVQFGSWKLYPVRTPGHTDGCTSFVLDDLSRVFTGDTLMIRACGRTDFQGGSADILYSSVHNKLYRYLPDPCLVYPAHDYKGNTVSSIGEEKEHNPRLTKSREEFVAIMNNLNLPRPKKIDVAVPANLQDGLVE